MPAGKPTTEETSDYYTSHRLLTFKSQLDINLLFVGFNDNFSYYNILKMKKEVFVFV